MRPARRRRAVERAAYVDEACKRVHAIVSFAKAVQHSLRAARGDAKDGATAGGRTA